LDYHFKSQTILQLIMKKLLFLLLITAISSLFVTCKKRYEVEILELKDTIINCKSPYQVAFYSFVDHNAKQVDYLWDFGDGNTSTEANPVNIYRTNDIFKVLLTVTNHDVVVTKSLVVDLQPTSFQVVSSFDAISQDPNFTAPCLISFKNNSKYAPQYIWNLGDNTLNYNKELSHWYQNPGTYMVTLSSICGADTVKSQKQVKINTPYSEISIKNLSVWLPSTYLKAPIYCKITYGIFTTYSTMQPVIANQFPVFFVINSSLFGFHGRYNTDPINVQIFANDVYQPPVYDFTITTEWLQNEGYPRKVKNERAGNYEAEMEMEYSY